MDFNIAYPFIIFNAIAIVTIIVDLLFIYYHYY